MKPTHIPHSQLCIHCKYLYRNCSHLPFNTYKVLLEQDGYKIVKCEDYIKRG